MTTIKEKSHIQEVERGFVVEEQQKSKHMRFQMAHTNITSPFLKREDREEQLMSIPPTATEIIIGSIERAMYTSSSS